MEITGNGQTRVRSIRLDVERWNYAYKFVDVIDGNGVLDTNKASDPRNIFISMDTAKLVYLRNKFTVSELRTVATAHSVKYFDRKKMALIEALQGHQCKGECVNVFYHFKELPTLKFVRPWEANVDTIRSEMPIGESPNTLHKSCDGRRNPKISKKTPSTSTPMETLNANSREEGSVQEDEEERDLQHLTPVNEREIVRMMKRWQDTMKLGSHLVAKCAVCSEWKRSKDVKLIEPDGINLELLTNDSIPPNLMPITYCTEAYKGAILDSKGLVHLDRAGPIAACDTCRRDLMRGKMPKLALANHLYYAHERLPLEVRAAFDEMTVFEKALICRVRTNSLVCRFSVSQTESWEDDIKASRKARHIRGNVISTPLNVPRLNAILPPSPSAIRDTICALFVSNQQPTKENITQLKPVLVRKSRIKMVIEFLMANNPHYNRATGFGGLSAENLEALFEGEGDLGVLSSARIGFIPKQDGVVAAVDDYVGRNEGLDGLFMENTAFTTGDGSSRSFREMCLDALNWCKAGKPFVTTQAGSRLVPDINNPNWLSWAHPIADPYGLGGFHEPRRRRPISIESQIRHMLNVGNPMFESDHELAFNVYNITRKAMVNTSLRFMVPVSQYRGLIEQIKAIDRDKIEDLRLKFKSDPSYRPQNADEVQILKTMSAISPVARGIPGSTAQRIKMRNEIRGIINQKGSPTLFVTLNPADHHNPLVAVLATRAESEEDIESIMGMTLTDRLNISLKHPVACAKFFDLMVKAFIRIILRAKDSKGKTGIFGQCEAYYGTVETQGRGALHCHMLIWLKGHLPAESLASALIHQPEYRKALKTWLDSITDSGFNGVRSHLNGVNTRDGEELIKEGEMHPGTMVGPNINDMSAKTWKEEATEYTDSLLLRYNWHNHTGSCWKYLRSKDTKSDENCRFGMDGKVKPETTIDELTGEVLMRRRHPKMTSYNPTTTFLMKCNTDIKFIGSGEDAKAFMYYVTDYITKPPLSMYAGLAALSYAIRSYESKKSERNTTNDDDEARRAMTIAVNSMLGHQEFSHPQVMAFLLGHAESYTSESFQTANWYEILTYVNQRAEEAKRRGSSLGGGSSHGGIDGQLDGLDITVAYQKGRVSVSNTLLDYLFRPKDEPFDSMGLYSFLAWTVKVSKAANTKLSNQGYRFESRKHPQFDSHRIKARSSPKIPVLLGPNLRRRTDSEEAEENWAKDAVILFKPWRDPAGMKQENETWLQTLNRVKDDLGEWEKRVITNMSILPEAKHARDTRPRHGRESKEWSDQMETNFPNEDRETEERALYEGNIYKVANEMMDESEDHSPLTLEVLVGEGLAMDFNARNENGSDHHENEVPVSDAKAVVEMMSKDENDLIRKQREFMDKCKFRKDNDSKKKEGGGMNEIGEEESEDENNVEGVCKDDEGKGSREGNRRDRTPNAYVDVMRKIQLRIKREVATDPWKAIRILAEERGLQNNPEQLRAFSIIAHRVIEGDDQLLMYVGGEGGTGKSYLITSIVMMFEILGIANSLRMGAYTGIAASLIGGQTLHSLLAINQSRNASVTKRLMKEWKDVRYLIIDEVSMIGAQFMAKISARIRHAKGDDIQEAAKPFGGVNVIFMGDFLQLAPPKQPAVYSHYLVQNPSFAETKNAEGLNGLAGAFLWRQVNKVVILRKNKRQEDDPKLAEILERMRSEGQMRRGKNQKMSEKQLMEALNKRQLATIARDDPSRLKQFEDAPVIVGNKILRDAFNVEIMRTHAKKIGEKIHLYSATDKVGRKVLEGRTAAKILDLPSRQTRDFLGYLPIFKGMKIMITENISVEYKIVNGSEGKVQDVRFETDDKGIRKAKVVYVKIEGCGIKAPYLPRGVVPIFPKSTQIQTPSHCPEIKSKKITRSQIPIVPSYAITDYKSQGRTLDRAIIDLATARGQGPYVMLSRTVNLEGVMILRWFPASKVTQNKPEELRNELSRLEELDRRTQEEYVDSIEGFMAISKETEGEDEVDDGGQQTTTHRVDVGRRDGEQQTNTHKG